MVATLLTLMDGAQTDLTNLPRIFVIGATNRPNDIDDALRRPGRFDREFEIGIPDASKRLDILKRILSKIPNNVTVEQIEKINSKAHGYVGADLAAVCREAGMGVIKRVEQLLGDEANDETVAANESRLFLY